MNKYIYNLDFKRLTLIVLSFQIAFAIVIGLELLGLEIPLLRSIIGFTFLTLLPGILLIRLLRISNLNLSLKILFIVGFSISILMFTGFALNFVLPIFNISNPISFMPLFITINLIILLELFFIYVCDREFFYQEDTSIACSLSSKHLFFIALPIMSILGTHLMSNYNINTLLLLLILIISLIPVLSIEDRSNQCIYPFMISMISISLLYHRTLISSHVSGFDVFNELYLVNNVIENAFWDISVPINCNSMLSVVMLPSIYSIILDIDTEWIFKIIYPLFLSLLPVGMFEAFSKLVSPKKAFLSCFFFISYFNFYFSSPGRQWIAELFFILLIILMIDSRFSNEKRAISLIIFGSSLSISHYGMAYIYMICAITSLLLFIFLKYILMVNYKTFCLINNNKLSKDFKIEFSFIMFFFIFTLSWYLYTSNSSPFLSIVHIIDRIMDTIFADFLNPDAAQGLNIILTEKKSNLYNITKYFFLITQLFIIAGFLKICYDSKVINSNIEFKLFAFLNLVLCFAGISVPYAASTLNAERLYLISLIVLAPFSVIGGLLIFNLFIKNVYNKRPSDILSTRLLALFFGLYLLFNSGWMYEVLGDSPSSISLDNSLDFPYFSDKEYLGAKWLFRLGNNDTIYSDEYRRYLLDSFDYKRARPFLFVDEIDLKYIYIYLGNYNILENKVRMRYVNGVNPFFEYVNYSNLILNRGRIYDNGGSRIYR